MVIAFSSCCEWPQSEQGVFQSALAVVARPASSLLVPLLRDIFGNRLRRLFVNSDPLRQTSFFQENHTQTSPRALDEIGQQSDIVYYRTLAKSVLNGPDTTGMGFWSINPYVGCAFGCAYCYARYAHRYVMERSSAASRLPSEVADTLVAMPPWLAFERRVFVKENAPEVLRRTLRHGSDRHLNLLRGEAIIIGTATDPYQPAERKFRVTRGLLEVIAEHPGLRVVIISKSPLVTRDVDVLARIARHSTLSVHISLITLDRELARRLEPRAPTPEARVRALGRLRAAGIDAGINCMPVLPGITDEPRALEALIKRVAEAGATYVAGCALRLRSTARNRYLPFIDEHFPHLSDRYRRTYASGHQAGDNYREGLRRFFERTCRRYGVPATSYSEDDGEETPATAPSDQLAFPI
jgi:DNA repair photolyase